MQANILIKKPILGKVGARTVTLNDIIEIIINEDMALLRIRAGNEIEEVIYPVNKIITIRE